MCNIKILIYIATFIASISVGWGQSPHGEKLKYDCSTCHNPDNWIFESKNVSFNHDSTSFPLKGQHINLDCRSCHQTLVFEQTKNTCISCHIDFHQQTVGNDCARCHNTTSWVVENITQMHEQVGFPLMGTHAIINCNDCHHSESNVRFSPINPECISCNKSDYTSAKEPDHIGQKFPVDCSLCHRQTGKDWTTGGIVHSFFPLEQGHQISDCSVCHKSSIYSDISPDCINCHNADFQNAKNPDHSAFPTDCNSCHTLTKGWMPASFANHDSQFPIYSGKHKGEWSQCIECHISPGDYASFSCIKCHEHNNASELAKEHDEVGGYQFVSTACYSCHPKGN